MTALAIIAWAIGLIVCLAALGYCGLVAAFWVANRLPDVTELSPYGDERTPGERAAIKWAQAARYGHGIVCLCDLRMNECPWPGQCTKDIERAVADVFAAQKLPDVGDYQ